MMVAERVKYSCCRNSLSSRRLPVSPATSAQPEPLLVIKPKPFKLKSKLVLEDSVYIHKDVHSICPNLEIGNSELSSRHSVLLSPFLECFQIVLRYTRANVAHSVGKVLHVTKKVIINTTGQKQLVRYPKNETKGVVSIDSANDHNATQCQETPVYFRIPNAHIEHRVRCTSSLRERTSSARIVRNAAGPNSRIGPNEAS